MKTRISILTLIPILAGCGVIFFAGCASMEINKTASLLSAAGFRVHTPQTTKEKELYATFPSNKLERGKVKGKVFYVFKDEKAGVEYVGGEAQHRRYQQLCMEQHVAPAPEEQMNDFFTGSWARQLGHDLQRVTALMLKSWEMLPPAKHFLAAALVSTSENPCLHKNSVKNYMSYKNPWCRCRLGLIPFMLLP